MTVEHWNDYVFSLVDLSAQAAKRRFRQAIKQEWGCCAYCGRTHDGQGLAVKLTMDHLKPRSGGGEDLRSNLVAACVSCNRSKGNARDWRAWFQAQAFHCPEREARILRWAQRPTANQARPTAGEAWHRAFDECSLPATG